ncbi:MAG: ATP-binding protein [Verrucomicrobia bacterium]|nr:ATP-binding protein [Verrucomicrobiota bacterium]
MLNGARYGLGEVGEFTVIESEHFALLGRIIEVRLPERDRHSLDHDSGAGANVAAVAVIQLLGTVTLDSMGIIAGVSSYPRLGDRVYSAPIGFLSTIPLRTGTSEKPTVTLNLGRVSGASVAAMVLTPEKIFGRHCAVLGATGGGKSYTVSRLIEECLRYRSKIILLDATGEYRKFNAGTKHVHLGSPTKEPDGSTKCSLPPTSFNELDFMALFEPAGKSQAPKLRAAIRSLRLVSINPSLASDRGLLVRANKPKRDILAEENKKETSKKLDDPSSAFNVSKLPNQILEECVYDIGLGNPPDDTKWGGYNQNDASYCMPMISRINSVLCSKALECVFGEDQGPSVTDQITSFISSADRLLRISLEGIPFEYHAREIIANALGRFLLAEARRKQFQTVPVIVVVDEAHNFLGRSFGSEDSLSRLDSFELIAKEGRKYGLNLCLATQRPRDITEGVLSQMGTLIVHRLTNDRDREMVERACGEIDRSASAFLPNLEPGEAAIVGVDFPIPLTIQINEPSVRPDSMGAQYQEHWAKS